MNIQERVWPPQELEIGPIETSWWTSFTSYEKEDAVPTTGITLSFPKGWKPALQLYFWRWSVQLGWFIE